MTYEEYIGLGPDLDQQWETVGVDMWTDFDDYNDIQDFLKNSSFGVDKVANLWQEEIEGEDYLEDSPYLMDIWDLAEKYPDVANEFFKRIKPKTLDEFRDFVTDDDINDYYYG